MLTLVLRNARARIRLSTTLFVGVQSQSERAILGSLRNIYDLFYLTLYSPFLAHTTTLNPPGLPNLSRSTPSFLPCAPLHFSIRTGPNMTA